MAAVTHGVTFADAVDRTSYTTASFTPATDDLLVVLVSASATVATGTVTDSEGLGFTKVTSAVWNTNWTIYAFVANAKATNTDMTVTFDCTGDTASGAIIEVARVSGMTKVGAAAARQSAVHNNGTASTTPAVTLPGAALTTNPVFGAVAKTSTTNLVPPSNWTESVETSITPPFHVAEFCSRDSGETGTTITWGSSVSTLHGELVVELDASPAPLTAVAAVPASATASRPVPLPKLRAIPGPTSATASRAAPVPQVKVISGPCRATASRAVPTVQISADRIVLVPPASATASFPIPTKTITGTVVAPIVVPSASARANPSSRSEATFGGVYFGQLESDRGPVPRITVTAPPASAVASGPTIVSKALSGVPVGRATAQFPQPTPRITVGPSAARATAAFPTPHRPTSTAGIANLPTRLRFAYTRTLAFHRSTTLVLDPNPTNLATPHQEMELVLDG